MVRYCRIENNVVRLVNENSQRRGGMTDGSVGHRGDKERDTKKDRDNLVLVPLEPSAQRAAFSESRRVRAMRPPQTGAKLVFAILAVGIQKLTSLLRWICQILWTEPLLPF
jgi:hypothetical protein